MTPPGKARLLVLQSRQQKLTTRKKWKSHSWRRVLRRGRGRTKRPSPTECRHRQVRMSHRQKRQDSVGRPSARSPIYRRTDGRRRPHPRSNDGSRSASSRTGSNDRGGREQRDIVQSCDCVHGVYASRADSSACERPKSVVLVTARTNLQGEHHAVRLGLSCT